MKSTTKLQRFHIRESHRRQFNGEDYQDVAHDIANRPSLKLNPDNEQDAEDWKELESTPRPDCDCGFCATAAWE